MQVTSNFPDPLSRTPNEPPPPYSPEDPKGQTVPEVTKKAGVQAQPSSSEDPRGEAVIAATKKADLTAVQVLLQEALRAKSPISMRCRGEALVHAAGMIEMEVNPHYHIYVAPKTDAIVMALLADGPIPIEYRDAALTAATNANPERKYISEREYWGLKIEYKLEVVQTLLRYPISCNCRHANFVTAHNKGYQQKALSIGNSGPLTDKEEQVLAEIAQVQAERAKVSKPKRSRACQIQ